MQDFIEDDYYNPPVNYIVVENKEKPKEQRKTKEKALDVWEGNSVKILMFHIKTE